jgi:hypothetical protein
MVSTQNVTAVNTSTALIHDTNGTIQTTTINCVSVGAITYSTPNTFIEQVAASGYSTFGGTDVGETGFNTIEEKTTANVTANYVRYLTRSVNSPTSLNQNLFQSGYIKTYTGSTVDTYTTDSTGGTLTISSTFSSQSIGITNSNVSSYANSARVVIGGNPGTVYLPAAYRITGAYRETAVDTSSSTRLFISTAGHSLITDKQLAMDTVFSTNQSTPVYSSNLAVSSQAFVYE